MYLSKIENSLIHHKEEVLKHLQCESQLVGVFLYGSQNYNLATENSDVDTVAIVLPTTKELYFNKPVTKEIHLDNGEHIVVKDIREFMNMLRKQNLNFMEVLFTKFYYINPLYQNLWNLFLVNRERIARYNPELAVKSITGQILHTLNQAFNSFEGKKYANALKMYYFLEKYLNLQLNYADIIIPTKEEKELILKYKNNEINFSYGDIINLTVKVKKLSENNNFIINEEEKENIEYTMNYYSYKMINKNLEYTPYHF